MRFFSVKARDKVKIARRFLRSYRSCNLAATCVAFVIMGYNASLVAAHANDFRSCRVSEASFEQNYCSISSSVQISLPLVVAKEILTLAGDSSLAYMVRRSHP